MTHFLLLAALFLPAAAGAPPVTVPPLTLERAVAIALDAHPAVRAARFGIVAAREAAGEARAPLYPELTATGAYSRWERHAFLPDGVTSPAIASTIGPTSDWFAGLSGRYLMLDSGERAARLRVALAGEHVAAADAAQLLEDLALAVHEAFHGLAAAMQARDAAEQEEARAREHLRLAEARKAAGAVPGADVIRARVGISESHLHVVSAEHLVRVAAGRLNTAMGLPPETELNAEVQSMDLTPPSGVDLSAAFARALAERPLLLAARSRIDAARGAVDVARSAFGPRLGADWRYGWRDATWWPEDRDWSAGVTVQWPIFNGFARQRARGRARADLARAEADLERQQLDVRQDVWVARSRLDETYEAARAAAGLVADAEESLRVSRERYRAGAGTFADLLDAEAALARAASARVRAMLDYRTARARFDRAIGSLAGPQTATARR